MKKIMILFIFIFSLIFIFVCCQETFNLTSDLDSVISNSSSSSSSSINILSDYVVIVGYMDDNADNKDWWIKKYAPDGIEETSNWNKMFDGGNRDDYDLSIAIDSDNNVYVVGYNDNGNDLDWWIKKFNSNGIEYTNNWNKIYDGENGNDLAKSVNIDSNNNVYVVGYKFNGNDNDWWVKKFSSDGTEDTTNWNKTFDGESGNDTAFSVAIDSNNNVYVVGNKYNGIDLDWCVKKFSSDGTEDTTNWNKTFDGGDGDDTAFSLAIDSNNNIYIAGYKYHLSAYDWWIKKFDSNGTEDTNNWGFTCDYSMYDFPYSMAIDSDDNIYVVGSLSLGFTMCCWLKKFNSNGVEYILNWDKILYNSSGSAQALSVAVFH